MRFCQGNGNQRRGQIKGLSEGSGANVWTGVRLTYLLGRNGLEKTIKRAPLVYLLNWALYSAVMSTSQIPVSFIRWITCATHSSMCRPALLSLPDGTHTHTHTHFCVGIVQPHPAIHIFNSPQHRAVVGRGVALPHQLLVCSITWGREGGPLGVVLAEKAHPSEALKRPTPPFSRWNEGRPGGQFVPGEGTKPKAFCSRP